MKNRYFVNINLIKIEVIKRRVKNRCGIELTFGFKKFNIASKKYESE